MNQQQFKILIRLSQTGSLSQVAREMNISQPTVTFHLKKLTEAAGVTLYQKRGDQIQFTDAGKMLLQYAKDITSLYEEAARIMEEYKEDKRGEIFVGASHVPANYVLPQVFLRFTEEHPATKLSVRVGPTPDMIEAIKEKKLDLAIVSTSPIYDPDLFTRRITDDPVKLIVPVSHPLAKKQVITLGDLTDIPFILQQKGATRDVIDNWMAKTGTALHVAMELSNMDAVQKMVALGAGCSILSARSVVEPVSDGVLTTKVLPHFDNDRSISVMYRKDRPISERMQRLITLIFQEATL